MKKTFSAIVAASAVAFAGLAQADAIFYPNGSFVELGDGGAETLALDSTLDTRVMGAPAAVSATATVAAPQLVYVQPNIDFDRATVASNLHNRKLLMRDHRVARADSKDNFNVPQRAGEASTMTGGAPNAVTDNHVIVGGYSVPHTMVTVDQPYYVMSW